MKRLLFLSLLISTFSFGQDNPYKFQIVGAEDTVIYLANYYGEKLYYADTAKADNSGNFSFAKIDAKNEGKYAIVAPGPKYFEIVIADDENIFMKTDTTNLTGNMEVLESENNKIMYDYMHYLGDKKKEREAEIAVPKNYKPTSHIKFSEANSAYNANCKHAADRGQCHSHSMYMSAHCPQACNSTKLGTQESIIAAEYESST